MSTENGRLNFLLGFHSEEMRSMELPVRVQRPNLTVAAMCVSSKPISLEPGTYYVTVRMPAGQELSGSVYVGPGSDAWVTLEPDHSDRSPFEVQEVLHFLTGQAFFPADVLESSSCLEATRGLLHRVLGLSSNFPLLFPFAGVEKTLGRQLRPRLRVFDGNLLGSCSESLDPPRFEKLEKLKNVTRLEFDDDQKFCWLQLLQPGAPALNVAFPSMRDQRRLIFLCRVPKNLLTLDVHLGNKSADLLLSYIEKGLSRSAEIMTTASSLYAEELLRGKEADPIAAAVGGYALLRLGALERLHGWTHNLRDWFTWLPDGLTISGEHLARTGRHEEALEDFLALPSRGLPFFSDGLSYAIDRLRLYTKVKRGPFSRDKLEAAERLLLRLEKFAAFVDFRKSLLTFTGLDPSAPDAGILGKNIGKHKGLDLSPLIPI